MAEDPLASQTADLPEGLLDVIKGEQITCCKFNIYKTILAAGTIDGKILTSLIGATSKDQSGALLDILARSLLFLGAKNKNTLQPAAHLVHWQFGRFPLSLPC